MRRRNIDYWEGMTLLFCYFAILMFIEHIDGDWMCSLRQCPYSCEPGHSYTPTQHIWNFGLRLLKFLHVLLTQKYLQGFHLKNNLGTLRSPKLSYI